MFQTHCLPKYWRHVMAPEDQEWVSKELFDTAGRLTTSLRLWWYAPEAPIKPATAGPRPGEYFRQNLFLWMPRKIWRVVLHCCTCNKELTSKGLYNNLRKVLDIDQHFYMATEHLECRPCSITFLSWGTNILDQLDAGHKAQFPCVMTHKGAVSKWTITLLRLRTLGNTPTAMHNTLSECHRELWLRRAQHYLTDCAQHKKHCETGVLQGVVNYRYPEPPMLQSLYNYRWLLSCYNQDVLQRLEAVKAQITSVFGQILKLDSTKKSKAMIINWSKIFVQI